MRDCPQFKAYQREQIAKGNPLFTQTGHLEPTTIPGFYSNVHPAQQQNNWSENSNAGR